MISTTFFKENNFNFRKGLGQNFIFDQNFLDALVRDLGINKADTIVEVGTGAGTLTAVLAHAAGKVITYEIDTRLEPHLRQQFAKFDNIELVFADAMKVADFPDAFKLVANIPYYITTPLLLKFMAIRGCAEICVLVQDDVAHRIVAGVGGKEYGALSVTMQAGAECKILKKVSRQMFTPVPKVDSAFVIIKKKPMTNISAQQNDCFNKLVKGMFAARRKTALNALRQAFVMDAEVARAVLCDCGINENIRPENISVDKYIELSACLVR